MKARVQHGRLVLDEPIDLPDGTEVDLEITTDIEGNDEALAFRRDQVEAELGLLEFEVSQSGDGRWRAVVPWRPEVAGKGITREGAIAVARDVGRQILKRGGDLDSDEDRAEIEKALAESEEDVKAGRVITADEFLAGWGKRRP
jgi:hypothetical protein